MKAEKLAFLKHHINSQAPDGINFIIFKKRLPLLQADHTRVLFVVCVYFFQDEKNILSGDCVLKSLIYIFFNLCLTYQHYMNAVYIIF